MSKMSKGAIKIQLFSLDCVGNGEYEEEDEEGDLLIMSWAAMIYHIVISRSRKLHLSAKAWLMKSVFLGASPNFAGALANVLAVPLSLINVQRLSWHVPY